VPQATYMDLPLPRETRKVFNEATTGPIRLKSTSKTAYSEAIIGMDRMVRMDNIAKQSGSC